MTYDQAVQKAKDVSRETGCVQHVESHAGVSEFGPHVWYSVSDWYDYETTVASFVNGKEVQ